MTDRLVRAIGRWSLAALMLNTVIGASIFGLPALIATHLGSVSPLGFLVAAAAVAIIAGCLAEVASQFRETGGPYLYARAAFGQFVAIQIGWFTWLTRIASAAAAANLFTSYLAQFVPVVDSWTMVRGPVLIGLIACLAALNYRGVANGTRVSNLFTLIKLIVVFVFVAGGLAALALQPNLQVQPAPVAITASSWLDGLLLMVVAFGGFEAALFPSGESRDPRHDVPMALAVALSIATVIYVGMQYVVVYTLADPGATTKPVADSALRFLGSVGAPLVAAGALVSQVGSLSANMIHTPRVLFAMGEQGDLPGFFGTVHPRFRTPSVAIALFAIVLAVFALLGSYQWNVTLTGISRMFIYGSIAAALPVLRRRHPKADAFRLPGGVVFSGLALIFTVALATRMDVRGLAVAAGTFTLAGGNWLWARPRRDKAAYRVTQ
jgi:amino acid transporter